MNTLQVCTLIGWALIGTLNVLIVVKECLHTKGVMRLSLSDIGSMILLWLSGPLGMCFIIIIAYEKYKDKILFKLKK